MCTCTQGTLDVPVGVGTVSSLLFLTPNHLKEILRPPTVPPARGNGLNGDISLLRWLPYALLSGLGLWGVFEGVRRTATPAPQRFPAGEGEAFVGPLLAFGSVLLSVLAIYYLYRAITRQD